MGRFIEDAISKMKDNFINLVPKESPEKTNSNPGNTIFKNIIKPQQILSENEFLGSFNSIRLPFTDKYIAGKKGWIKDSVMDILSFPFDVGYNTGQGLADGTKNTAVEIGELVGKFGKWS